MLEAERIVPMECGCRYDGPTGFMTHYCSHHDPIVERRHKREQRKMQRVLADTRDLLNDLLAEDYLPEAYLSRIAVLLANGVEPLIRLKEAASTVHVRAYCDRCRGTTRQLVVREDEDFVLTRCPDCGARSWWSAGSRGLQREAKEAAQS